MTQVSCGGKKRGGGEMASILFGAGASVGKAFWTETGVVKKLGKFFGE